MDPATVPLTFFRKASGSITGPHADIVRPAHVRLLDYEVEIGLVIGAQDPVGAALTGTTSPSTSPGWWSPTTCPPATCSCRKTQFYEAKSYPTLHPRRARAGAAGRRRARALHRPAAAAAGQRRTPAGRRRRQRHDLPPLQALQALARFQRLDPGDLVLTGTPVGTALKAPAKPMALLAALLPPARKWKLFLGRQRSNPQLPAGRRLVEATVGTDDGAIDLGTQRTRVRRPMTADLLWPEYATPDDLAAIEAVPLGERGLPETTYALLARAARLWPDRVAVCVLPDAERSRQPAPPHLCRTARRRPPLREPAARAGRAPRRHGRPAWRPTAPTSPRPWPPARRDRRPAQRGAVAAAPGRAAAPLGGARTRRGRTRTGPDTWETAQELVDGGTLDTILVLRPTAAGPSPAPLPVAARGDDRLPRRRRPPRATGRTSTAPRPPHDLAALFHTGGTTGAPEAGRAHARDGGGRRLDAGRLRRSTTTRRCSPRCRCSTSTRSSSPC